MPTRRARGVHDGGRPDVRPRHRASRDLVDQVGRQEREPRAGGRRLEGAAHVGRRAVGGCGVGGCGVERSVIELVVADGQRVIAQRVVGVDDERALRQVRLDPSLEGVACIQQQHRAAVPLSRRAEIAQIPAELRDASAPVPRKHAAVQVGGAHDRQRHAAVRARRLGALEGRDRAREQSEEDDGERRRADHRGAPGWP